MDGQNHPVEQTPHLAPALTAVILGVVVLAAFGAYARSLESRRSRRSRRIEAIIRTSWRIVPDQEPGHRLATGGRWKPPACCRFTAARS